MFKRTVLKLTVLYSFLFFVLFWVFSIGLYVYLDHSFKQGHVARVNERVRHEISGQGVYISHTEFSIEQGSPYINKAAEVTLENFRTGLIILNAVLLLVIPFVSWLLAKKTLSPIHEVMQRQKQFVSDASHELLTPLTIVANEIEVALRQQRDTSYYARTLETLKGEISRLSTLVSNLLLLAKHEGTAQPIPMQEVELVDVVSKVVSVLSRGTESKKARCHIDFPEDNIVVKGNPTMLEQLFMNLIDNALKFSPPDTEVTVSVQKKIGHVEVSIQDQGRGISKEEQLKVFDRFYRVDSSRTETKGYGLGLPIAQTIAALHGGHINLHSHLSQGSIFTVVLPALS